MRLDPSYPAPGTVVRLRCDACGGEQDHVVPHPRTASNGRWDAVDCNSCNKCAAIWWSKGHLKIDGYLYPVERVQG